MIDWPQIIAEHGPAVWRTVYRIVGEEQAAHDCYQETFLAAVQQARQKPIDNWAGLLRALASRRAIDQLRRRAHRLRMSGGTLAPGAIGDNGSAVPGVDATMRHEELRQAVRRELSRMPPRQAEAFCLRHFDEMDADQIAGQMSTTPRKVAYLLHHAKEHLRQALKDDSAATRVSR